jgi:diacylglycerol kinase family enzyme
MKKALVIYNPVSGSRGWKDVPRTIVSVLEDEGWDWDWFDTMKASKQPLEPFKDEKYHRIIVAGGDGTVGQVVDFMLRHNMDVPLVIVPQGSANLLAATLAIPHLSVRKAVRRGLTGRPKKVDAMRVNGKRIAMIAVGRGYDVFLMKETTRALKRHWGIFAYVWIMFKTFFSYRRQVFKLTIDGKRHHVTSKAVIVFNAFPLAYWRASQLFLGKRILPNDGQLNLFTMGKYWRIVPYKGKKFVIKSKEAWEYQLDGDVFKCRTLTVEVIPKAISVVHENKFK